MGLRKTKLVIVDSNRAAVVETRSENVLFVGPPKAARKVANTINTTSTGFSGWTPRFVLPITKK